MLSITNFKPVREIPNRIAVCELHFDTPYKRGGETIDMSDKFRFAAVDDVRAESESGYTIVARRLENCLVRVRVFQSTGKPGPLEEVPPGTELSGIHCRLIVEGVR